MITSLLFDIKKNKEEILKRSGIIQVGGWLKLLRIGKNVGFIELNDGSSLDNLQLVFSRLNSKFDDLEKLKLGSYLLVEGHLFSNENNFELKIEKLLKISDSKIDNALLQKKKIPFEFVRQFPHLRSRTNIFFLIFKIRGFLSDAINKFFQMNNFLLVSTPIITKIDTEGAGESFKICNENEFQSLTVSGQLHLESFAQGFGRVYNFSPCFRAEKSHTVRHLSEFWMIEAEFICKDLEELMNFSEKFVKDIIFFLIKDKNDYLEKLSSYVNYPSLIKELDEFINMPFKRITYNQALEILKSNFFSDIDWGSNFNPEQEKFICNYFSSPVFVTHFPSNLKAFYMKNKEGKDKYFEKDNVVECFDLLFPKVGEVVGGSIREDNLEILKKKIRIKGINGLNWYEDLRIQGYEKTGGFGLGLERLIMFICKIENIQDTIPFPNFARNKNSKNF